MADTTGWLSLREAADRTGLSPQTIRAYAARHKIRCEKGEGGEPLYDPESLPLAPEESALVDVIKTQTAALRASHEQVQKLTDKVIGMSGFVDRVLSNSEKQIERLCARCDALETELRAGRDLVDRMQTSEAERAMARAAFEADMARKQKIAETLSDLAKPVISSLMFAAAPGSRAVQDSLLAEMLEDFDDGQIAAILDSHPKTAKDPVKRAAILEMRRALREQRAAREKAAAEKADAAAARKEAAE